jgi:hypothetical protein
MKNIYKLLLAIAVIIYAAITGEYYTVLVIGAVGTQTVVTGTRTTSNVLSTMSVRDVEPTIALLKPYQTPIEDFFFSGDFPEEVVTHPRSKFEWYEDAFLPDTMTLVDAIAGGAATEADIVVSGNYFLADDTILIEATGEMARVTAVDTANTEINIIRIGGGVLTAAGAGSNIQRIVPAFKENGSKQSALTVQAVNKYGYCQILKKGLSMTGRQQAGNYYGGNDWKYQWKKALMEIKEAVERMYLYNVAAYDDATNDYTYSAGIPGMVTTNVISYAGDLDEVEFDEGMKQIFDSGGSNRRVALAGSGALMMVNKFIKAKYELRDSTQGAGTLERYGPISTKIRRPKILTYMHAQGDIDLVWEPQLKNSKTNSIYVLDPENIKRRFMDSDLKGPRKYRREMGIETPGADSYDAQYLFDIGLQMRLEETCGIFNKS